MSAETELNPGDEASLVASAKRGDQQAFELLAGSYKRILKFYIKHYSAPDFLYDDLFQEGLIGLLKAVRCYDGKSSSFATFASLCIRNSIISGLRKFNRQASNNILVTEESLNTETSPSPEDVFIDGMRANLLYDKVSAALSPYERTVFELYLSDISYESIAFVTGKSVKSTENAVYRIRNKLKSIAFEHSTF